MTPRLINEYEANGRGHWPSIAAIPFGPDDWGEQNVDYVNLLRVRLTDPTGDNFYPLGITLGQAVRLNGLVNEINIGSLYSGVRHLWPGAASFPTDVQRIGGFPGVSIFDSGGGFGAFLGLNIAFLGGFAAQSGPIFCPDGNCSRINSLPSVFPTFGEALLGEPPDRTNIFYNLDAVAFYGGLHYPFIHLAWQAPSGGSTQWVFSTYGTWVLDNTPNVSRIDTGKVATFFDWGDVPIWAYYNNFDPVPFLADDLEITEQSLFS